MSCVCDYERPSMYSAKRHVARKPHKCYECCKRINPGETYERVASVFDGDFYTCATCHLCLALRDWTAAHVPCVCWAHGNMNEDCMSTIEHYAHEAPGLYFGALRRLVAIKRTRREVRT